MSYFELPVRVECPHCCEEMNTSVEFNMGMADNCGVNSGLYWEYCSNCNKDFWFKAYCSFETEMSINYKRKPNKKAMKN